MVTDTAPLPRQTNQQRTESWHFEHNLCPARYADTDTENVLEARLKYKNKKIKNLIRTSAASHHTENRISDKNCLIHRAWRIYFKHNEMKK